jgi:hypothetical protein
MYRQWGRVSVLVGVAGIRNLKALRKFNIRRIDVLVLHCWKNQGDGRTYLVQYRQLASDMGTQTKRIHMLRRISRSQRMLISLSSQVNLQCRVILFPQFIRMTLNIKKHPSHSSNYLLHHYGESQDNEIKKEESAYARSRILNHQFSHEAVTAAMALLDVPIRFQDDSKEDDDHAFQDVEIATREKQTRGVDEAFLTYSLAEKAALMIQQNFRSRHPELKKNAEESINVNFNDGESLIIEIDETEHMEENDPRKVHSLILVALFAFGTFLWKGLQGCPKLIRGTSDTSDTGVDDQKVSNMAILSGEYGRGAAPPGIQLL